MACEGCNCYFSFWVIFYPFTHLTAQKIKFLKNEKKAWRYHLFTHVHQKFRSDDVQFLRYEVRHMDGKGDI